MGFPIDESHLPYRLSDGLQLSPASVESPNIAANGCAQVIQRRMLCRTCVTNGPGPFRKE